MARIKLSTRIIRYRFVIILIYEFLLLIGFYIFTKFKFENNNSLILIGLMVLLPILLGFYSKIIIKRNRKKIKTKGKNYFDEITRDYKTKKLQKELLEEMDDLGIKSNIVYENEEITLSIGNNENILINLNKTSASVYLKDTYIIYNYYYNEYSDLTKYDQRNISSFSTSYLYKMIKKQVLDLYDKEFIYKEYYLSGSYNGCSLLLNDKEVYNIIFNSKKKIFSKKKTIKTNIITK